ncbi:hypothetical protein [Streptomyces sp. NPDC093568]|uniref:hypothetical protein n=1 Tax=Streptomyces sp. NPDC093568 TaxID=3366041 RepID=UPI00380FC66C
MFSHPGRRRGRRAREREAPAVGRPGQALPEGEFTALGLAREVDGDPGKGYSSIRDPWSGKEVSKVRGSHLLAWADDRRLIAWERVTGLDEPYRPRLVLVTIGSDRIAPLSGVREPDKDGERQGEPVFARR